MTWTAKARAARWARGETQEQRFWARVRKTDTCWVWTGPTRGKGYGAVRFDGRMQSAHRVSWEMKHGPIGGGLHVLHRCDNPPCINPDHLFLGTNRDNAADCRAKGRTPRGWKNGAARLTPAQVEDVRQAHARGFEIAAIARHYGVARITVRKILTGKSWAPSAYEAPHA